MDGWNSKHTSLKPFTYPIPETRFFHAGVNVYKFKIKYGNSISTNNDLHGNIVNEELEEAVRVILGNLNNLHPFTTEHLVLFPYLNKWEKVSALRFKCGDIFLVPYPYVCTVYIELNSRQQNVFLDKTEYRDACNFVEDKSEVITNKITERPMKCRRPDSMTEVLHSPLYIDRSMARDATCIHGATRSQVKGIKFVKDIIHPPENQPEETPFRYCSAAIVDSDYDNITLGKHVGYDKAENSDHGEQDGRVLVLPQRAQGHVELKNRGFLQLLKSTLFPPFLQHIFNGINQPS